ncbi:hypothetical protein SHIRM173S_13298 [Streptomyces hirsutus]
MGGDEVPQVGDERLAFSARQPQREQLLGRGDPTFLQNRGGRVDHRSAGPGQDGPAPQGERRGQFPYGVRDAAGGLGGRGGTQMGGELQQVEPDAGERGSVAGAVGDDHLAAAGYAPA